MHTPEGLLTNWVCVLMWIISIIIFSFSFYKVRNILNKKNILLLSSLCALVFGFQMLNFPIANGTSGHFIGAGLIAIMLGPYAAVVGLAVVLLLQAIFFGDGGVFALGANIFNMGVVAGFVTYYIYIAFKKYGMVFASAIASLLGVVSASIIASIELSISGTYYLIDTLIAMVSSHLLVGLGEAFITILPLIIINYNTFYFEKISKNSWLSISILGLLITLVLLPFASQNPDAMERVAINFGFYEKAIVLYEGAPFADYTFFGTESIIASYIVVIIGMIMSFAISYNIINFKIIPKIQ